VISTNQFKVGMTIRYEGETYRIASSSMSSPQRRAFVRTKLRNVSTGSLVDRTFRPEQKFDQLRTESRTMTYLYDEPDQVVFMDAESFEQLVVPKANLAGRFDLMTPNMPVEVVHIDEVPFDVELPTFVDLKVADTAAGCGATPCREAARRRRSRQVQSCRSPCSSNRATLCVSTHVRGVCHPGVAAGGIVEH